MQDKQSPLRKGHYRLFQAVFLASFIFLLILSILGILYEDDIPFAGFIWLVVVAIIYWIIKRIFYHDFSLKST